ncbi:MAG: DUF5060 domain-containing protein [Verrucomicrobiota bacterium]
MKKLINRVMRAQAIAGAIVALGLCSLGSSEASAQSAAENTPTAGVYGETAGANTYRMWHKVTVAFAGPNTGENANPNPFTNYRLNVTFTHPASGQSIVVPGYYAADGNSGETSATSGNIWRVHFRPFETGTWNYSASFRTGNNVVTNTNANAGSPTSFNGATGSFNVVATNKTGRDFRAHGRLEYVGKHHLRHAGSGKYFFKYGADSPENPIAYVGFDNTPLSPTDNRSGVRHVFAPHIPDWNTGDPQWKGTQGRGLIGALNYLASVGAHSWSTLVYSIDGGDDRRIFPWTAQNTKVRFDCSKLDQWAIAFSHANNKGLNCTIKLAEEENHRDLTGNNLHLQYREMVARFGHNLGVQWVISEEFGGFDGTDAAEVADIRARGDLLASLDPWDNNLTTHTGPGDGAQNGVYGAIYGRPAYTGASMQISNASTQANKVFNRTLVIRNASANNGQPWVVSNDEQGPANQGVRVQSATDRKHVLWGNFMAGGAGVEYYINIDGANLDANTEDYRVISTMWTWSDYMVNDFITGNNIPFWDMANADNLTTTNNNHCLAKVGDTYVVHLYNGGTTSLNLGGQTGDFEVKWFDPRNGGALQNGSVTTVTGGGNRALGSAPNNSGSDWAVLVRRSGGTPPGNDSLSCSTLPSSISNSGSVDVSINYEAAQGRDIVIALWDSGFIANQRISVPIGSGVATATLNLSGLNLPAGSNYSFRALLWETGQDWGTAQPLSNCGVVPVTLTDGTPPPPLEDSLNCATLPASIPNTGLVNVTIDYEAVQGRDIVVALWNSGWLAANRVAVPAGTGTATVSVDLSSLNLPAGSNYSFRALMWQTGETWGVPAGAVPLANCGVVPVTLTDGTPPPPPGEDTLNCSSLPATVAPSANANISIDFEATQQRDVVVAVWTTAGQWVAANRVTVAAGTGTATVPLNLSSVTPGNYYFRAYLWNVGENWGVPAGAAPLSSCNDIPFTLSTSGGGGGTVVETPTQDAYLQGTTPFNDANLKVEPNFRTSYLKFDVNGVGTTVTGSKLVLQSTEAGNGTIRVFQGNSNLGWTEVTLTAATAPAQGAELGTVTGNVANGSTIEIDLGTSIGNGEITLVITMDGGGNDVWFSSSEGANAPRLEVTFQ